MKGGCQRNAKLRPAEIDTAAPSPIDLGIAVSVYGKDADGKLVEIEAARGEDPCWYGFSLNEAWPTEQ